MIMNRRAFLKISANAGASICFFGENIQGRSAPAVLRPQPVIPRWRGFNLIELMSGQRHQAYQEADFQWMARWGLNDVCLAWMSDLLSLWKEAGWGWSMWNLRGPFGVLDSDRSDVTYEERGGHRVDRKMLELLVAN
jgi:aryl-phospho-beta-D-glucosidase BglC (GH1 family)